MIRPVAVLLLVFAAVPNSIAGRTTPQPAPWPTGQWARSAPAAQNLDPAPLEQLVATIRADERIRNVHGLLIVKNGYLVLEEYFAGYRAERLHTLQSVTKSVASAVIGIAIARGEIEGVDEPVLGFFPRLAASIAHVDERKRAMTLEDLLTMRSGTDYHERGPDSPHDALNRLSRGWTKFVLDRPMVAAPGTTFNYDSGAVILSSAIVKARSGVHADRFADEHLFGPLGITERRWYRNAEGHPHTGGGLSLRPRDMAKFGLLYLRDGRWEERQLIPRDWVRRSLAQHVRFERERDGAIGYGYWWWTMPDNVRAACGFMGQYIFLVPDHDMIVVVTAGARDPAGEMAPVEFLYETILPAAHGAEVTPRGTGSRPPDRVSAPKPAAPTK